MDVDLSKKLLLYVNPAARGETQTFDPTILQKASICERSRWLDGYVLF